MLPPVRELNSQSFAIGLIQLLDRINAQWVLRNQGALSEQGLNVLKTMFVGEVINIFEQLSLGDANKRVFDPAPYQRRIGFVEGCWRTYSPAVLALRSARIFSRRAGSAKIDPRFSPR